MPTRHSRKPADTPAPPPTPTSALLASDRGAAPAALTVTWDGVAGSLGAPTDADRVMYAIELSAEERVALGRRVATAKILTDLLRWTGDIASWVARTPAEARAKLVGFSLGHVRVAFEEGQKLRALHTRFEGGEAAAGAAQGGAEAHVVSTAVAVRHDYDALYTALDHATAGDAAAHGRVTAAWSKATKAKPLSAAVTLLCTIAGDVLGAKGSPAAARLAAENVTPAFVAALANDGKALAQAGEHADGPRAAGPVTERDLDLQDGTCLAHMRWLYDYFGVLHAKDPGAPQLVAIATRAFFVGHPRGKAVAVPEGGPADGATPA